MGGRQPGRICTNGAHQRPEQILAERDDVANSEKHLREA